MKIFKANEKRLNIKKNVQQLEKPQLIIHGDQDETVPLKEAQNLHLWNSKSELIIIEGASHTFNIQHPWLHPKLSEEMEEVVDRSITFILA